VKRAIALVSLAMAGIVVLSATAARGDAAAVGAAGVVDVPPRLMWARDGGAESCISQEELNRLLAQALGGRGGPSALGQSSIEGRVSRGTAPRTWVARVRIVSESGSILGEREFSTSEEACSALTPSVLLVLLILIDPEAADRAAPKPSSGATAAPAPPPTLALPSRPTVDAPPSVPARRGSSWQAHLEPIASLGLLSGPALGLSGGVSLITKDGWQLALSGGYAGKTKVELEPNAYVVRGHVLISGLLLDLSVCPSIVRRPSFAMSGCVGATLVTRFFQAEGLPERRDPAHSSLGPSLSVQANVPLTEAWQLRGQVGSALLMPRENFVYEDGNDATHRVYTPSRLFGSLSLGLATTL